MEIFKNLDWKEIGFKALTELLFAVAYFVIMSIVLKFVFSVSGTQVDDGLIHVLSTMTILITYFNMMDKRDSEDRFEKIDRQLEIIDETVGDNWNMLDTILEDGDYDELSDTDLDELIEEINLEKTKRGLEV